MRKASRSTPCSQGLDTGPSLEPYKSNPHPTLLRRRDDGRRFASIVSCAFMFAKWNADLASRRDASQRIASVVNYGFPGSCTLYVES